MDFLENWVNLAMQSDTTTSSYSVLINKNPQCFITFSRGISQIDPLAPYLFLLCVLLRKATKTQQIKGIMSCHGGVHISHLLFVDNSLLFCHITPSEAQHLMNILGKYEAASGQAIYR